MRQVTVAEKHERKVAELEQKLTMNASLWQQLAES